MTRKNASADKTACFTQALPEYIWETKYRYISQSISDKSPPEASIEDTWSRVARFVAHVESRNTIHFEHAFYDLLKEFRFLPGGRILAGAGTSRRVTLFNCFVMGAIEDSITGIFDNLKEAAVTLQQGGGVGYDFSTLRPAGSSAKGTGVLACGPVPFMAIWDAMCATVLSTGARAGAMMATLRCDHPDIEAFIGSKRVPGALNRINISVLASDAFVTAVKNDAPWQLVFPLEKNEPSVGEIIHRLWGASSVATACRVHRVVSARQLWDEIMKCAYEGAEPGVLFVDRINQSNNLSYRETISATNPCGELPLPPYGACNLGSLNLAKFIRDPFSSQSLFDFEGLETCVRVAVRFLDNVIDVSTFPLPQQAAQARGSRRIGLGITGLADALLMLGIRYGSDESFIQAQKIMSRICHTAYDASVQLACERGPFPFYNAEKYLESPFVLRLPADLRERIREHGIRNSHLLAIAPAGTISVLANNVSSGLEPIFAASYSRRVRGLDGAVDQFDVVDYAVDLWRQRTEAKLPPNFVDAYDVTPDEHLAMQAALQPFVDSAISKTINIPERFSFERFKNVFLSAYDLGLKGVTAFRPNAVTGEILSSESRDGCQWCDLTRDSDA